MCLYINTCIHIHKYVYVSPNNLNDLGTNMDAKDWSPLLQGNDNATNSLLPCLEERRKKLTPMIQITHLMYYGFLKTNQWMKYSSGAHFISRATSTWYKSYYLNFTKEGDWGLMWLINFPKAVSWASSGTRIHAHCLCWWKGCARFLSCDLYGERESEPEPAGERASLARPGFLGPFKGWQGGVKPTLPWSSLLVSGGCVLRGSLTPKGSSFSKGGQAPPASVSGHVAENLILLFLCTWHHRAHELLTPDVCRVFPTPRRRAALCDTSGVSCPSTQFWHRLPGDSIGAHGWRAQSHETAPSHFRSQSQLEIVTCASDLWL